MKKLFYYAMGWIVTDIVASALLIAAPIAANGQPIKLVIVDFKKVIEESKLGKQEQNTFDSLKKQMETVLEEKEKSLNEMATKLNDNDYLDSLTPEAETELKRKFRALNQELQQQQAQYFQTLNQSNMKIVQKLQEIVTKACEKLAKDEGYDMIVNDDACFYCAPAMNVSSKVVKIMDEQYEEPKELAPKTAK